MFHVLYLDCLNKEKTKQGLNWAKLKFCLVNDVNEIEALVIVFDGGQSSKFWAEK